ncbi:MAG TPA: FprA family A-type flavoprotein [Methanolinea sp.]|jgi:flavorubredoxin|nr:MAG: Type A flavoprotein FprA [Methanoregulaceae archaeon PtaB.Bin009]OPY38842.1 MAG: Type A flavoprotein FprA [Methanoregulaceae archaeon PtaU1.Bin066]HII77067.1 FprA family A-type flavoprotein [Methanolinea sp.]HNQ28591.1 FprA family A-type flavoprotein [Methanolinea sp.]
MVVREIAPDIFSVGALDFDRRLFDSLIPLPQGTSYNSYLVKGTKKTALIDTVDPTREMDLVTNLVKARVDTIDYLVVNHAEQDHSGSLPMMAELFPKAKVVVNEKCLDMVTHLLDIGSERCMVINDRDTVDLGGKTLEFLITPWVHWPETMLTYAREDRVLFSCDLFGSHMAESTLRVNDWKEVYHAAKRYYAEIMMPFSSSIREHMEKIDTLDIAMIAPSHGPIHTEPNLILDAYRDWISDKVKNEVVIPYVSMHGSTEKMVQYLTEALIDRGIRVLPFNLVVTDIGELAMALVDSATVVIGTPTVIFGPHPQAVYATYLVNMLRPKTRIVSVIGSFGWGGRTVEVLKGMLTRIEPELLDPVYIKGAPGAKDLKDLDNLADAIAKKHREFGILT